MFDDDVRDAVTAGADLLTVPTNNATFGHTNMTYQQQGMSRLRAIEHDRAVVIAATSGQSAVIAPDGTVLDRTGALYTPGVLVDRVPLRTTTTLATRLGAGPEWVLAALGVAAVAVGAVRGRRRTRERPGTPTPTRRETSAVAGLSRSGPAPDGTGVLVVVPTYDERENLPRLVERVLATLPRVRLLVVDDGSPDGTGDLADDLARADPRLSVLHHRPKRGLGAAYVDAFAHVVATASRRGDRVGRADGRGRLARARGPPRACSRARAPTTRTSCSGRATSRAARVVNWPWYRNALSRSANAYSRRALRLPVRDVTGGFRLFRRRVLEEVTRAPVSSQGYCFQVDLDVPRAPRRLRRARGPDHLHGARRRARRR